MRYERLPALLLLAGAMLLYGSPGALAHDPAGEGTWEDQVE